jgi:ABC-type amino acid transport substrate-binding protein
MKRRRTESPAMLALASTLALLLSFMFAAPALADLKEVKERGVLRHLGVVYANFVTGSGDGLDVEMMKLFAERLGVGYEFVETSWSGAILDML